MGLWSVALEQPAAQQTVCVIAGHSHRPGFQTMLYACQLCTGVASAQHLTCQSLIFSFSMKHTVSQVFSTHNRQAVAGEDKQPLPAGNVLPAVQQQTSEQSMLCWTALQLLTCACHAFFAVASMCMSCLLCSCSHVHVMPSLQLLTCACHAFFAVADMCMSCLPE